MSEISFDEESRPGQTEEPDWDEIERRIFGRAGSDTEKQSEAVVELLRRILGWVYGDPKSSDKRGIANRSIVACWFIMPEIQRMSLTKLSSVHGCSKQNLGKVSVAFQNQFPGVSNSHLKK